ncbi:MAG: LacI family transcriptional regulator [Sphingomonadales bacterium]|nr:LacI family transcriptional regulator [Sphingomonadales bacterium]
MRDVARAADVSVATVSYVMNDTGSVGELVRARVRQVAEELGYRPNQSAKAMRTGRSQTLGLILPDLRNPFFAEVAQAVQMTARQAGYAVILVDSGEDVAAEREGADDLVRYGVDGIIWCPSSNTDSLAAHRGHLPITVVARPLAGYDAVASDYEAGGAILADFLVAQGYPSVAIISGPQSLSSARFRRDGFISRLAGRLPIAWEMENAFSVELGPQVRARLLRGDAAAIVCGNDLIAIGAIRTLIEAGIRVPEDAAVLGYDDIPWAGILMPSLTTIHQALDTLGREAVDLLMRRIDNRSAPELQRKLPVALVTRRSTAGQRQS